MPITSLMTPAIEQTRITTISHFDDAASPAAASYAPGYNAKYVSVDNVTDRIKLEWYEGMASNSAVQTAAAGARTLITTGGVSVQGNKVGFPVLQNKQYRAQVLG